MTQSLPQPSERDWTVNPETGRSNSSPAFQEIVKDVESIIRGDAATLIAGRAGSTAHLIVANLAHRHGLAPLTGKRSSDAD